MDELGSGGEADEVGNEGEVDEVMSGGAVEEGGVEGRWGNGWVVDSAPRVTPALKIYRREWRHKVEISSFHKLGPPETWSSVNKGESFHGTDLLSEFDLNSHAVEPLHLPPPLRLPLPSLRSVIPSLPPALPACLPACWLTLLSHISSFLTSTVFPPLPEGLHSPPMPLSLPSCSPIFSFFSLCSALLSYISSLLTSTVFPPLPLALRSLPLPVSFPSCSPIFFSFFSLCSAPTPHFALPPSLLSSFPPRGPPPPPSR